MDWRDKVELFEQIRREYEFGTGTIQGVARKLGVHRRMGREFGYANLEAPVAQAIEWGGDGCGCELIVIDKLGHVPLTEVDAELLFQVSADRAEKAAIIVTTNLPFSEWPQVFTNARLCKAVLDRLTDQDHIIETGSESYRFRRTLGKKRKE